MRRSMTKTLAISLLLGAVGAISASNAADLPRRQAGSSPIFASNWAGFYAGAHLGYGNGRSRSAEFDGFIGGIHAGYNVQSGSIVMGGVLDLGYSGVDYRAFTETFRQKWQASARARLGYSFDRFLPFVTAGLAYTTAAMKAGGAKASNGHVGYVIGIGGEMMITDRISANLQYLHYRFSAESYSVLPAARSANIISNEIRAGISYKF